MAAAACWQARDDRRARPHLSYSIPDGRPVDHRHRRRKRQRQDDAGACCCSGSCSPTSGQVLLPRAGRGDDVRGASGASSGARCSRSSRTRTRRSTRSIASTTCWRRRSSASAWPRSQSRRAPADRGSARTGRTAAERDARAISAPAQRRPAPAHHGRAGAAVPPEGHRGRRAGVDGRRVAARDDPGELAGSTATSASRSSTSRTT